MYLCTYQYSLRCIPAWPTRQCSVWVLTVDGVIVQFVAHMQPYNSHRQVCPALTRIHRAIADMHISST